MWKLAAFLALGTATAAISQSSPVEVDGQIEQLKPGEYLWAPGIAPAGPVIIVVNLKTQRAYAYRNGVPIGVSTVSTGAAGHRTPTGVFTILQKDVDHVSNIYSDAPMPFMQRLTWGGIALHAGNLPGYPASHGCVRLPPAFAKLLYGLTRLGMTVVITEASTVPVAVPVPPVLAGEYDVSVDYDWHPERSATGPVSIVISGRDRRLVVLRNGVEIGSSAIVLDDPVAVTAAFTLQSIDAAGQHWFRLPLPGQPTPVGAELTAREQASGHLPVEFSALLATILKPGTTILVTRDTLKAAGTGQPLTVVAADAP
ncbi:L,D-transpeptidase [Sphingomonas sp. So64.6b]|uniref:L,D-transpeptidase n=1 Tax=Sphingomonas sp. So64.6b TaxID=2997354 RepID=UPI00160444DF|nr:L,D-transpeptidase [Sphingomonas sp. So64.6b]QNA86838.1 L,D-transpeptidase [Sphingomonas sp. So64.6b]